MGGWLGEEILVCGMGFKRVGGFQVFSKDQSGDFFVEFGLVFLQV